MMISNSHSGILKKPMEMMRLVATSVFGLLIGILIGSASTKYGLTCLPVSSAIPFISKAEIPANTSAPKASLKSCSSGAEALPPSIVVSKTDLYQRRLWGKPDEDLAFKQKYLVTFTVGFDQRYIVDAAVSKFSKNWTVLLFHYDGRTSEWDQFDWSRKAIHISARKQTKWWFAKRFLHPDVVAPYDYVFLWDEDLDVEHFNAETYLQLVEKHGLEISQPGLDPSRKLAWQITKRLGNSEVHKVDEGKVGRCPDPHKPPCAGFVEIMAPVFSRNAWRCVWHMIQNDLVHGWGLDFALGRCVEPAHEKVGVVDAQWIVHKVVPSLGSQGKSLNGKAPWEGVQERCKYEWQIFRERMEKAEKEIMGKSSG